MKKLFTYLLTTLVVGLLPMTTASAITMNVAENIVITQNIFDDAYFVSGNSNIEADIFGDLYIVGGNVAINGVIHEDLVVAGGRVSITGEVLGDLRVIGGQVAVYGNIGDDLLVAGGQVDVGNDSVIGGSLVSGAGILTMDGVVTEDIRGGIGMLIINGTVEGDVVVTVEDTITITDKARIGGDLKYSALLEADLPEEAIGGEILFNKFEKEPALEKVTYLYLIQKVLGFLASLIILFAMVMFTPKILTTGAKLTKENVFRAFGVGLLGIIISVIAAVVLMVTIVGIPISLVLLAILWILIYLAKIFASAWMASYVLNYKKKMKKMRLFGGIGLALLAYYLLGSIPFIGWLINLVLFFIGVGTMMLAEAEYFAFLRSKNKL